MYSQTVRNKNINYTKALLLPSKETEKQDYRNIVP